MADAAPGWAPEVLPPPVIEAVRKAVAEHGLTSNPWHSEAAAIRGAIPAEPCYSPAPLRWLKRRT